MGGKGGGGEEMYSKKIRPMPPVDTLPLVVVKIFPSICKEYTKIV